MNIKTKNRNRLKGMVIIGRLLFLFFISGCVLFLGSYMFNEYKNMQEKNRKESVFNNLSKEIRTKVDKFPGEVSIYIKDLQTGIEISYNDSIPLPSASIVKIPIMVCVFQAVKDGNLGLDDKIKLTRHIKAAGSGLLKRRRSGREFTVRELMELMITESDNTATNMLVEKLGMDYINWLFANKFDLKVTNLSRNIMDLNKRRNGIENFTTAKEIGMLLEKIYNGELVSREYSAMMLEILSRQKINDRIPRFLPSNLTIAHKTGLMDHLCHDSGIIFTPNGNFIICVLTNEISSMRMAKRFIGDLAYKTYMCY